MIDGWFALLTISFVSSVGGLIVLLVQTRRDDAHHRNESGSLGRSIADNRPPASKTDPCANSPRPAPSGHVPSSPGPVSLETMLPLMVSFVRRVRAGDSPSPALFLDRILLSIITRKSKIDLAGGDDGLDPIGLNEYLSLLFESSFFSARRADVYRCVCIALPPPE